MKLRKMNIIELQDFFNAFYPRLSAKSIRLMHAWFVADLVRGPAPADLQGTRLKSDASFH